LFFFYHFTLGNKRVVLPSIMSPTFRSNNEVDGKQQVAPALLASLKFKEPTAQDLVEKPYDIRCIPPEGMPRMNFRGFWVRDIPIFDMRPLLPSFSLDVQGFHRN
jgi:hypothetical protein